jgi:hypothetical protein
MTVAVTDLIATPKFNPTARAPDYMLRVRLGKSQNIFVTMLERAGYAGGFFKTVSSRDAAVERTGMYLPRVLKNPPTYPVKVYFDVT